MTEPEPAETFGRATSAMAIVPLDASGVNRGIGDNARIIDKLILKHFLVY